MSRGQKPLVWMVALTVPAAAHSLGLGEIHVNSALNEPLAAEIEIVGAGPEQLNELRASLANRETFVRYGVDRPAFLSSATFKVARDSLGRPILAIRSTESCVEPLVNFLVDLRWHNGELIREYSLLLDPASIGERKSVVAAVGDDATARDPSAARDTSLSPSPSDNARARSKSTHFKVGAKATLRGIAWRFGVRTEPDLQRMMIAIYRTNPAAFDGNINRLHRGAIINIPPSDYVLAISYDEAKHEIQAQMAARQSPPQTIDGEVQMPAVANHEVARRDDDALNHRLQSLEQSLNEMQRVLSAESSKRDVKQPIVPQADIRPTQAAHVQTRDGSTALAVVIAAFAFAGGVLGGALFRRRRWPESAANVKSAPGQVQIEAAAEPVIEVVAQPQNAVAAVQPSAAIDETAPPPVADDPDATAVLEPAIRVRPDLSDAEATLLASSYLPEEPDESTVNQSVAMPGVVTPGVATPGVATLHLDYDLNALETTAQHVQMPSLLNEQVVFKERRTNLVDVLRTAVNREPERRDLRMKLLELYYAAAATNRQGFAEVVQKLAREKDFLPAGEWQRIASMGRQILPENPIFFEEPAQTKLADCA